MNLFSRPAHEARRVCGTRRWAWIFRSAVLAVLALVVGEVAARLYYFVSQNYGLRYLAAPFVERISVSTDGTEPSRRFDPESDRFITFTMNSQGGRGREWTVQKRPGSFRVAAMGASTTFGINNPDWATWPVLLEEALRRRYGVDVEVLNASVSGKKLVDLVYLFERVISRYKPDVVIYYGAWNDTYAATANEVNAKIHEIHSYTSIGSAVSAFYYRSMLYTYLLEKATFHLIESRKARGVPEIERFRRQLEGFVELVRKHRAILILVPEVNDSEPQAAIEARLVLDPPEVRSVIVNAVDADRRTKFDRATKIRFYQAQVLGEVIRRTGATMGVLVIDPWPAFAQYRGGKPLFYGPDHHSDLGNRVLADAIAEHLDLSAVPSFPHKRPGGGFGTSGESSGIGHFNLPRARHDVSDPLRRSRSQQQGPQARRQHADWSGDLRAHGLIRTGFLRSPLIAELLDWAQKVLQDAKRSVLSRSTLRCRAFPGRRAQLSCAPLIPDA